MSIIVTIGGGENGRTGYEWETKDIDNHIVELTGKQDPSFLFIGTATHDHQGYIDIMKKNYTELGCTFDHLPLENNEFTHQQITQKIDQADIIYVGGGSTRYMMDKRKETGVDKLLLEAYGENKILCGLSAGSICRFDSGQSDSEKLDNNTEEFEYIEVKGLGILPAIHTPHINTEKERRKTRLQFVQSYGGIGIALDDCCAMISDGNKYKIITCTENARGYRCYFKDDVYHQEEFEIDIWGDWEDLLNF